MASTNDFSYLVSAGPTREWIDPFRFISNPSSGKMGIAIADEVYKHSNRIKLLHGVIDNSLLKDKAYECKSCETTNDLLRAMEKELSSDMIIFMAAAPSDFRPVSYSDQKIKKNSDRINITFEKNPDILMHIAQLKLSGNYKNMITVGFAAETQNTENYALSKLKQKSLDFICLNDISKKGVGFAGETNEVTIYCKSGEKILIPMDTKVNVAKQIFHNVTRRI
ncbi:MAG: phosphopantothenoylcysteine decarboxylase [Spirochaetes bacterium]|nr:phosphopantothenoylcysteine decarboxylase [Spirochaetota bacterium]MBN2769795.1 phosphopantothenoylcysteine decarboxylase [Spirochaetota bacterium]